MTIAKSLLSLQDTDQALALRRRDYREVETELKSEGGLPELRESCEKTKMRELESKVETARLESEMALLKDKVTELETRLYGGAITNVRELTAIETEHSAARRSLAQIEESIAPAEVSAEHARQQYEDMTKDLAVKDRGFLEWILKSDFPRDTREIVQRALNGVFPVRDVPKD